MVFAFVASKGVLKKKEKNIVHVFDFRCGYGESDPN